jgi:hypothetical protein
MTPGNSKSEFVTVPAEFAKDTSCCRRCKVDGWCKKIEESPWSAGGAREVVAEEGERGSGGVASGSASSCSLSKGLWSGGRGGVPDSTYYTPSMTAPVA